MTKVDENIKISQNLSAGTVEICCQLEKENKELKDQNKELREQRDIWIKHSQKLYNTILEMEDDALRVKEELKKAHTAYMGIRKTIMHLMRGYN